ncbi:hypothetical protein [Paenibacillus soyae]|uniref:Uncharacterized protein n=1 Tax=Paenibacillus soyae TaxID=2969249 RepID=A0A9X2MS74_9BACL|nr:hypothetical protein [Paenibacillus soyae]MCR2805214.1 hypothetical protein [Paenibacillus soyae]
MKQTLLIKHAVSGRLFYDSRKSEIRYAVGEADGGWMFRIETERDQTVEELLKRKDELNVFIFREYDDQPTLKTWYYVGNGPVQYDDKQSLLTIYAGSRIEYYPHEYSE